MKIKMNVSFFALAVMLAVLTGCATMSKDECRNADWYLKGLDDAGQGYAVTRVDDHAKACARIKISPNQKDYRDGHAKGARLYCVPEKGYSTGRNGSAYNGICPPDLEGKFLRAYRDGQELYTIQRNMDNLANQIEYDRSLIDNNYNVVHQLKHDIVDSDDEKERRYKMRRIDDMQHEITDAEIRIYRAYHELDLFKNDFRIVEDKHFRMGYIK